MNFNLLIRCRITSVAFADLQVLAQSGQISIETQEIEENDNLKTEENVPGTDNLDTREDQVITPAEVFESQVTLLFIYL